jgi:dihydropteroate synthase-like protein
MSGHTLFLTGHLAEQRLRNVLGKLGTLDFAWTVHDIGVQVAALMTAELIRRRLPKDALGADRVVVPGYCQGDLAALGADFQVPFERGPNDLHDIPAYLGREGDKLDLSRHNVRIFAEIVDAPKLAVDAIVARARHFAAEGADVIDLGCLPDTPFPHLEDAVAAVKALGLPASVDSADPSELKRGDRAGADFVLSLSEATLDLAEETSATPVLIPSPAGDLDSLCRAADRLRCVGRPFIVDSVLDPIPFGFTRSLLRYAELRRRLPEDRILMGTGNVTELTDADTTGLNALLFGIIAELAISDVLVVQVSPHCRRAIRESDRARRIMFAAHELRRIPVGIEPSLMALRDRRPYASTPAEIEDTAAQIRDRNFRIEVATDGIHLYNRDQHQVAQSAFDLYPKLGVEEDGAHAFYLGVELARAEIAWQLGKRYVQDENLRWGSAIDAPKPSTAHGAPGPTLEARQKKRRGSEPDA